jgi:hypothetical protein
VPGIDVQLVYDRFIGEGDALAAAQRVLVEHAPEWYERVAVDLRESVLREAGERGPTYHAMVERYGRPEYERFNGSGELRGTRDLTVVVSVDEWPVSPLGDALQLGNTVTLQLRRARVQGRPARVWAASVFEALAAATAPAWGAVWAREEYDAKVMSDGPGVAAIGRDFGRFLPGLFTVNFFGPPYVDLIGRERLLGAPGARAVGDGVLIAAGDDPSAWAGEERRRRDDELLDHLGREFFFAKTAMPARTRAPDWRRD